MDIFREVDIHFIKWTISLSGCDIYCIPLFTKLSMHLYLKAKIVNPTYSQNNDTLFVCDDTLHFYIILFS